MKRIIASSLLVLLWYGWAVAATSVWKAQKGGEVIYLGGTFHLLREGDYPLPPEFERAYAASDLLVFETDIALLQEPVTQQRLLARAMYGDGSTIDKHLSPRVYAELRAYCEANGIPLDSLSRFRPSFLLLTLTIMELQRLGAVRQGVDQHFHDRALKERKEVAGLETVEEQLGFLLTMADGDEDEFVTYSLRDLKQSRERFDALSAAWRSGDDGKLVGLLAADFKKEQPKLYRKLITERNRKWLPLIESGQKPPRTRFVLVGVAHLVGEDGIIAALRKKGYRVEKL